jgi:hypothetical protein
LASLTVTVVVKSAPWSINKLEIVAIEHSLLCSIYKD